MMSFKALPGLTEPAEGACVLLLKSRGLHSGALWGEQSRCSSSQAGDGGPVSLSSDFFKATLFCLLVVETLMNHVWREEH